MWRSQGVMVDTTNSKGGEVVNRRDLLTLGVASGTAGAAGIALGYRYHGPLRRLQDKFEAGKKPPANTPREKFRARSRAINELHRRQTKEDVQALKTKYEGAVLGKFRVWGLDREIGSVRRSNGYNFAVHQPVYARLPGDRGHGA